MIKKQFCDKKKYPIQQIECLRQGKFHRRLKYVKYVMYGNVERDHSLSSKQTKSVC